MIHVDMPNAAAYMAMSGVCAERLPAVRAECLATKCSCWTKTEKIFEIGLKVQRIRDDSQADDDALWNDHS